MSTVTHIVLVEYTSSATPTVRHSLSVAFRALQQSCQREGTPYILTINAGSQLSTERLSSAHHGFVVTFDNEADLHYYVNEDLAHSLFKDQLKPWVQNVEVFDLVNGQFLDEEEQEGDEEERRGGTTSS